MSNSVMINTVRKTSWNIFFKCDSGCMKNICQILRRILVEMRWHILCEETAVKEDTSSAYVKFEKKSYRTLLYLVKTWHFTRPWNMGLKGELDEHFIDIFSYYPYMRRTILIVGICYYGHTALLYNILLYCAYITLILSAFKIYQLGVKIFVNSFIVCDYFVKASDLLHLYIVWEVVTSHIHSVQNWSRIHEHKFRWGF